jgi:site-specific DNA-methyltransferase (adenine-specific)
MTEINISEGDCLELMKDIPSGSVDMILCDLPYGTTSCKWDAIIPFEPLWGHYERVIKINGVIVLTASQPFTSVLVSSNIKFFKYELIWDKKHGKAPGVAKYRPMPSHESILIFGKGTNTYNPQWGEGKPYVDKRSKVATRNQDDGHKFGYNGVFESISDGRRHPLSVIEVPTYSEKGSLHPTQKPVPLMEYLIKTYTNDGETVLDNCMGSGTTGIACLNTNRNFIGIEKDPKYFQVAKSRIETAQKEKEKPTIIQQDLFT